MSLIRGGWLMWRSVRKQGERLIAKHIAPGEELLHRDLVEDRNGTIVGGLRAKDRRLDAVATTRAVYFQRGGQVLSILRYDSMAYASSSTPVGGFADRLELIAHSGETLKVTFPTKDDGLGHTIKDRLLRLDAYDITEEVLGAPVTLHYTPWRPDTMSYWRVDGAESIPPTPEAEAQLQALRRSAGDEVLRRSRVGPVDVPSWELAPDWLDRDWSEPLDALLAHHGLGTASAWAPGHQVGKSGRGGDPLIVGVSSDMLCLVSFESMRPLLYVERSPEIFLHPLRTIADWEICPEPDGRAMIRLLVLNDDDALRHDTLGDALKLTDGHAILAIGIADSKSVVRIVDAIVEGVKRYGAFTPGDRDDHPLWVGGQPIRPATLA